MTKSAKENVVCIGREITEDQQRWGFRCIVVSAMIAVIGGATFSGDILTMVALNLGGEEAYVGFLKFLIFTAAVGQIFIVGVAQRVPKKKFLITIFFVNVAVVTPILAVQWIGANWGQNVGLTLLALIVGVRSLVMFISVPSWMGMLREFVAEDRRGRLLGLLRTSWQSTLTLSLILVGIYLGRHPLPHQIQVVLIIGIGADLLRVLVLFPVAPLPVRVAADRQRWWQMVREPLRDRNCRSFLAYTAFYGLAMGLEEGFRVVYLWRLGFGQNLALISAGMTALGAVLTLMVWGKLADRFGNRNVFSISLAGFAVCTLCWFWVRHNTPGLILAMLLFFWAGAFNGGNSLVHTRYLFAALRSEMDASYIAVTYLALQLAVGAGSLLGGQFLLWMDRMGLGVGESAVNNYHLLFLLSFLAFLIPWQLRLRLREPKEKPTREVIAFVLQPLRLLFGTLLIRPRNSRDQDR